MNKSYRLFKFKKYLSSMLFTLMAFLLVACSPGSNSPSNTNVSSNNNNNTITASANTTAQNLAVGVAATNFTPLTASGGTAPYTYSYTGTLPTGLSFNPSTGVVSGTPAVAYTTAIIIFSVKDANNVVASTTSSVGYTVSNTATQHYAFVASAGSVNYSVYNFDPATGLLSSHTGSPFTASASITGQIVIHPNGNFAYFAGSTGSTSGIQEYLIGANASLNATGSLYTGVDYLAIESTGKYLYAIDGGNPTGHVYAYSINQTSGALTLISSYLVGIAAHILTIAT